MDTSGRSLNALAICILLGCGGDSAPNPAEPDPEPEPPRQPEALVCAPQPERLVAWYPAEGTADDAVGDADGTLDGPARYRPGFVGEAFDLGARAAVRLDEAPTAAKFTIEGWVRPTTTPTGRRAVYGTFLSGLLLRDGRITWWQDENAAQGPRGPGNSFTPVECPGEIRCDRFVGITPVEGGRWTHIALTYDGSEFRSYVDGALDRAAGFSGGVMTGTGASPGVGLWARDDFPFWFVGLIDELSVYNGALSASEVEAIWNAGSKGKCGG